MSHLAKKEDVEEPSESDSDGGLEFEDGPPKAGQTFRSFLSQ